MIAITIIVIIILIIIINDNRHNDRQRSIAESMNLSRNKISLDIVETILTCDFPLKMEILLFLKEQFYIVLRERFSFQPPKGQKRKLFLIDGEKTSRIDEHQPDIHIESGFLNSTLYHLKPTTANPGSFKGACENLRHLGSQMGLRYDIISYYFRMKTKSKGV